MNTNDSDKNKGLYNKFDVRRMDGGSDPGGKHEHCRYFVIDIDHDKHAPAALKAYAKDCRDEYPALAADLDAMVKMVTQVRLFIFVRADGFYPLAIPEGSVEDHAKCNPGTLRVEDAETGKIVWTAGKEKS